MRLRKSFLVAALLGGLTCPAWATDPPPAEPRQGSEAERKGEEVGRKVGSALDQAARASKDAWITAKVKTDLLADPLVKATKIDVDTRDQVVTLSGVVTDSRAHQRVLEDTRAVKGVKQVVDRLTVGTAPAPREK